MARVLVTGGSGFIGSYCILALLVAGHTVRTTVRDLKRETAVRRTLTSAGEDALRRLSFFAANLEQDAGWREAIAGCDYVLHVASPTLNQLPKSDDEMVVPAREGVLRVLRAARDAGVKRVVLTSAFGAIAYGHPPMNRPFTEEDWTQINDTVAPYQKSKTLAERAAWDFIASEGGALELAVVNPTGVLGPVLGPDFSPSLGLIQRMLDGAMPFCPKFASGFVDVRDVADLHIKAMTSPAAKGERFLAVSGRALTVLQVANILRKRLGERADRVPRRELPNWVMRLAARRNPAIRMILPQLGKHLDATAEKAHRLLGWSPMPIEDSIAETAESLLRLKQAA
jgi:nucleoside-diphosphate-sugar epimerase